MRPVLPIVGLLVLGCTGLLEPSGKVVGHRAWCGAVELTIESGPMGGTAPLLVDGVAVQEVDLHARTVPLLVPMAGGTHTVQVGAGEPTTLEVPASDLQLRVVVPAGEPLEGDPVGFGVQVLGSCVHGLMRLETVVQATGASQSLAVPAQPQRVVVGNLAQGQHDVQVRLVHDDVVLLSEAVRLTVGPPCRSGPCRDRDGDGFEGPSVGGTDCDDTDPTVFPGAEDFPDPDGDGAYASRGADIDCDGVHDLPPGPFDCDETDPRIPREEEPLPTGVDEDCDGLIDEGTTAYDDDGDGLSEEEGDCNDADPTVSPEKAEQPDCKDNDCDGDLDEGVVRSEAPDRYEPNDDEPFRLPGAQRRRSVFGGYHPTDDELLLTVAGVRDVESFSLFAHDGSGDSFHVTARILSAGDGLTYRVSIQGPSRQVEEVLGAGGVLRHGGKVLGDDWGDYTLRIEPAGETPTHCPLQVELTSG